ncbi:GGDEF domain-containing protein [Dactylosporangium salmoneum]|uniref:GGDEF domain-containing protein n=1 Tax=Dactylosporangium salmoneum TaxID=53361 RepID=A0ABP5T1A6_9ACTN
MRSYLAAETALVALSFAVPDGTWWQVGVQVLTGWLVAYVLLRRRMWSFGIGVAANAGGMLYEAYQLHVNHAYASPSWQDAGYLTLYPAVALGLLRIIRRRSEARDWSAILDAATVSVGLGLLAWVFMVRPALDGSGADPLAAAVAVAYPAGDVLVLAMLARLLFGAGARTRSFWLLSAAMMLFLAGDAAWAVVNTLGVEPNHFEHRLLGAAYLVAYALIGLSALDPSAGRTVEVTRDHRRLGAARLALLTAASLISPVLMLGEIAAHDLDDALPIALSSIALFLLVVVRMMRLLRELEAQTRRVSELSLTDELTGLPNRRAWNAELPAAVERARRGGSGLTVVMIDLDHFKRYNDEHGHPAGDRLLKSAAAAWSGVLRRTDTLARYGGEEFVALLPGADPLPIVRRLMEVTPLSQTFSAGVARWDGRETSDELLARADVALYEAKRAGRNRFSEAGALAG